MSAFEEARARYYWDTPLMVRELWGPYLRGDQGPGAPDAWQDDVMRAYDRGDRRIAVRSCYGAGKTSVLAWLALKQLLFVFPQRTVLTSASGSQLWSALWNEVQVWLKRLPADWQPLFVVKSDRVSLAAAPEDSYIEARTCRAETPEALQGIHCDGGRVLLGVDEASAVPDEVYDAGDSSMSGANATSVLITNPTRRVGLVYRLFTNPDLGRHWTRFHVPAGKSSRFSPALAAEIVADKGKDSNEYRVKVLAEFPTQQADPYLPWALIQGAVERQVAVNPADPCVWGVDVGLSGDRTVLVKRQGRVVLEPPLVLRVSEPDTMLVAGALHKVWADTLPSARPSDVCVDAIGYGAGVADRLRELGLPVVAVNVSEVPAVADDRFDRVRDQLWGALKEWLARRDVQLPHDQALTEELSQIGCDWSSGKLKVWKKAVMRRELGLSPDCADALCLTFGTDAAAVLYGGQSQRRAWDQPLKRAIRGVV